MPRRVLLALVCAVLALHLLALRHLPLGGAAAGAAPQRLAFQTRMVEPPPAPPPTPSPPSAPKPLPSPSPAKTPPAVKRAAAPAPKPPAAKAARPSAPDVPADADADAEAPSATTAPPVPDSAAPSPSPDSAAPDADASTRPAAADAMPPLPADAESATMAGAAAPGAAASGPALAASAPSATAAADPPAEPETRAGVTIQAPGSARPRPDADAPPVRLPASARLRFEVTGEAKRFHYNANAELLWRNLGATYEARQEVKAFLLGSRSQTSTGRLTSEGLQPIRFGDRSRSEQAAHFDQDNHVATFSANTPSAPIGPGAQDRLSVFIQLGALLAAAPDRYPPGTQITLTTVGARNADRWTFTVEGPETLELPIGQTPALKLQRLPRSDRERDQKAELWLGTQMGYLPVRIRLTQPNGDFADLALRDRDSL